MSHAHHTCHSFQFSSQTAPSLFKSDDTFILIRANELVTYLHKRGYNQPLLRQEITRAKNIIRNEAPLPKCATTITTDKSECVPFIHTYNPALRSISSIIRKHIISSALSYRCHAQHIQVCTYCCLPTQLQPHQLSRTS